jgi:hypothetical protein
MPACEYACSKPDESIHHFDCFLSSTVVYFNGLDSTPRLKETRIDLAEGRPEKMNEDRKLSGGQALFVQAQLQTSLISYVPLQYRLAAFLYVVRSVPVAGTLQLYCQL